MNKRHEDKLAFLCLTFMFLLAPLLAGGELNREINLRCEWLFEIGDNLDFADPNFNDSKWVSVNVPNAWENEGFPGFNGYGWYRMSFIIPKQLKEKTIVLKLGQIDDVDRTYFNGRLIGGYGDFPPDYQTAYDVDRVYELPSNFIEFGKENVLAVRIYDHQGSGGIVHGEPGIYSKQNNIALDIDLSGMWKFKAGDDWEWATVDYDDQSWKSIAVPSTWEQQGHVRLDGYAWYRKSVRISKGLAKSKLILLVGKVNDIDQVYFNGALIGETGTLPKNKNDQPRSEKNTDRAYFIPPFLIQTSQANIIAVRVYDIGRSGGIYSGHVGIATRDNFLKYSRKRK